jgi:hypothetical protein
MPNVVVNDLKRGATGDIIAFTYGRGAFALRSVIVQPPIFAGLADVPEIRVLETGDLELTGTTSSTGSVALEFSTDLENWSTLQAVRPINGAFDIILRTPNFSPAFFRVRTPP